MKVLIHSLIIAALLSSTLAGGAASAEDTARVSTALDNAEVRIPYAELRRLWEAAHVERPPAPQEPPPAGKLLAAQYRLELSSGKARLEAEFRAESFTGKWEHLPVMGAGLAVASVDPPDARLIVDADNLCLLAKESGPISVKVRFVEKPLPASGELPLLKITTVPSAVASMEVSGLPEGRMLKLGDGSAPAVRDGVAVVALPARGGEIALSLADAAREPKPEPPQPSEWTLQNEALVFEGDGELIYRARVHAMALNGSALEATISLPANARAIKVSGEDLDEARHVRSAQGVMELRTRWKTRDVMERELQISYALQQLPLAPEWELRAPTPGKDDRVKTLFILALQAGMEFRGADLQGPVPAAKLPRWIAEETRAAEFGTVMAASGATLQSRLLPRLETAPAIVTRCEYVSKLVGDGSMLTEASLVIEHTEALRWSFALPEKSGLLKCSVNGVPARPIARDGGVMEIPLEQAAGGKAATSNVAFSYTATKEKFDPVEGQTKIELPLTPLFINDVTWNIEIPESFEFTAIGGNTEPAPASRQEKGNVAHRTKKLCRNERPDAEVFYRKRGLE